MSPERQLESQNSKEFALTGRVFYLTKDPGLIRAQIKGEDIGPVSQNQLRDRISTDEIAPSTTCMRFSDAESLGKYLLTGIPEINQNDLKGKFQALVVGKSFGRGSSREHAQLALKGAGIELVIADSIERIFNDNCTNYGIYTLTSDSSQAAQILQNRKIDIESLLSSKDIISQEIAKYDGLLPYTKARLEGNIKLPDVYTAPRPMTIAEKIIAKHAKTNSRIGVPAVKPSDVLFAKIDSGYAYELQSVISQEVLEKSFPDNAPVRPEKFYLFEDHLALMESDDPVTTRHRNQQKEFAKKYNLKLYEVTDEGVEGICHTVMVERHILPGDLVLGNDSHTCTGGAANALAIGKGASEFAAALLTEDVPIKVPESIRFNLAGKLPDGVTSKDLMLYVLSMPEMKDDLIGSNRVFEFGGETLNQMPFDDQIVLTNMAIEGQGFTGIIEPNRQLIQYIMNRHSLSFSEVRNKLVYPDKDAKYSYIFDIDLSKIERMIALPGDTQNGISLSQLDNTPVNFAYIGSCTGGKYKDLKEASEVLNGRKIADWITMKVQASSLSVYRRANEDGLIDIFEKAGAQIIQPGCGDCMGATKDAFEKEEIVISDTNRNFPGRMGKKRTVYLANPAVVAASAILGRIGSPEELK